MSQDLYQKLKDAGFWDKYKPPRFTSGDLDIVPVPPMLHELIEACGDDLLGIRRTAGLWFADAAQRHQPFTPFGSTPEEAVAKLWLALNNKTKK